MYMYIDANLEKTASPEYLEIIRSLKKNIETGEEILFGLLFSPRHPYWIKKIRCNYRLIADLKLVAGEQVLCCTHLLHRGSHEYLDFLRDHKAWGNKNIKIDEDQIIDWLRQYKESKNSAVAEALNLNLVPNHLQAWLEKPILFEAENVTIFESETWVNQWRKENENIQINRQIFHRILMDICDDQCDANQIFSSRNPEVLLGCSPDSSHTIAFSRVDATSENGEIKKIVFLLSAFAHRPDDGDIAKLGYQLKMFGASVDQNILGGHASRDRLAQFARRAYPSYLILDEEVWYELERETEVNLALSGEEENLLCNMSFPAFINGRAGSGKSMMLCYAFSYYCDLYLKNKHQIRSGELRDVDIARPLFLTCSDRLTQRAREAVGNILSGHSIYRAKTDSHLSPSALQQLKSCFQTFQEFLLTQLPIEVAKKFPMEKYVSFYKFKQYYLRSFPGSRDSAELCWHVIRAYIKGFEFSNDSLDFMTSDEYQKEVSQADKSVDDDTFDRIFNKVFAWYQRVQDKEGLWDDQDLTRAALIEIQKNPSYSRYAAIFCDEAQDFTRIELQLILRLSVWSQYNLYGQVNNLPFAFAGDPMQTLNPTGFGWQNLRAHFYQRILTPLDTRGQFGLLRGQATQLLELQQNYRSPRDIVRFSNVIHLWRRVLFDRRTLKPQLPWYTDGNSIHLQKGVICENLLLQELIQLAQSSVIFILPCDINCEVEFLQTMPDLITIFPEIEQGHRPPNVYSAIAVKGMEFPSVIVLGFGEYFAQEFGGRTLEKLLSYRDVKLEYFLNKLYVAVSRSKDILAVVDTKNGDNHLWRSASQNDLEQWLKRLEREPACNQWSVQTNSLKDGFNMTVFQKGNLVEVAKEFLLKGIEQKEPNFIETSAYYYRRDQRLSEAEYCRAWLLKWDNQIERAGNCFQSIQLTEHLKELALNTQRDAWRCFWEAQCWLNILKLREADLTEEENSYKPVVKFMAHIPNQEDVGLLEPLSSITKFFRIRFSSQQNWNGIIGDPVWSRIFEKYREAILRVLSTDKMPSDYSKLLEIQQWQDFLIRMAEADFARDNSYSLAALCAYCQQHYSVAIDLWEKHKTETLPSHKEYFISKATLSSFPQNIYWLSRAKETKKIIEVWQSDPCWNQQWEEVNRFLYAALTQHNYQVDLLEIDIQRRKWVQAVRRFNSRREVQDPGFDGQALQILINCMSQDKQLNAKSIEQEVISLDNLKDEPWDKIKKYQKKALDSVCQLIFDNFNKKMVGPGRYSFESQNYQRHFDDIKNTAGLVARIGGIDKALEFYQIFRTSPKSEVRNFACSQWYELKLRQADASVSRGQDKLAKEQREQADYVARTGWLSPPVEGLVSRLNHLLEPELNLINQYISFLEFQQKNLNNQT